MVASPRRENALSSFVSYALLVALAVQYGLQPYLTLRFLVSTGVESRAVVLCTELLKGALCALALALGPQRLSSRGGLRLSCLSRISRAALPAACYLAQNLALQRAYARLDSLTFNCLNQTKVVATALTLYLLAHQGQSWQQCVALAMVVCAGVLLQARGEAERREVVGSEGVANFRRGVLARGAPDASLQMLSRRRIGMSVRFCALWPRIHAVAAHPAGAKSSVAAYCRSSDVAPTRA
jgi:hypothetical protein